MPTKTQPDPGHDVPPQQAGGCYTLDPSTGQVVEAETPSATAAPTPDEELAE